MDVSPPFGGTWSGKRVALSPPPFHFSLLVSGVQKEENLDHLSFVDLMAFDTRVIFSRLGCRSASLNKREQRALVSSCTEIRRVKFRGGG